MRRGPSSNGRGFQAQGRHEAQGEANADIDRPDANAVQDYG